MAEEHAHVTIEADVDDDDVPVYSQQDLRQNASTQPTPSRPLVSGKISSTKGPAAPTASSSRGLSSGNAQGHRQVIGGVALESRYTANSSGTLDEPLSATLVGSFTGTVEPTAQNMMLSFSYATSIISSQRSCKFCGRRKMPRRFGIGICEI